MHNAERSTSWVSLGYGAALILLVALIAGALVVGARDKDGSDAVVKEGEGRAVESDRLELGLATVTETVQQPTPGAYEAPFLHVAQGGVLELPVGPGGTVDYVFEGDVLVEGTIRTDGRLEIRAKNVVVAQGANIEAKELGLEAREGKVEVSGRLRVATQESAVGGSLAIIAHEIAMRSAEVNADGDTQGGTIAFESPSANEPGDIFIDPNSGLSASAVAFGNGGSISLRARDHVDVFGGLAVTGGPLGGNGGRIQVETHTGTSGITFEGTVDVSAPEGQSGRVFIGGTEQQVPDGGGDGPLELSLTPAD